MEKWLFFALFFGGFCTLGALIWYLARRMERKRTEAWQLAANDLGFEFTAFPGTDILSRFPGFQLFTQAGSKTVKNLLRGVAAGLELTIFDYSVTTGSGKNRHTVRRTVLTFEFDEPRLPTFSLRPENLFHKIGKWFGFHDIDFESHPRFSKSYLLRGEHENAVRECFRAHVLEYFEESPKLCVEASGGRLVYYRASTPIEPSEVRSLMEDGFRVLALFRPPA
jgi:hypothetical protein